MKIKITLFVLVIICIGLGAIKLFSVPIKVVNKLVNYPNPFDSRIEKTTIYYELEMDASVRLEIYDLLGYLVDELYFNKAESGGRQGGNRVVWDGTNGDGRKVAKGGYICRIYAEYDDAYACATRKIGVIH